MTIDTVKNDWDIRKEKLKQKFAKLTDNDLLCVEDKTEEMLNRLELKLGKSKDELKHIISNL